MTKHKQPQAATDAAQAYHSALGAWLSDGIHADPVTRSRCLDALGVKHDAFRHEVWWERRRIVLEMSATQTLVEISKAIEHSVAALHQWKTGDRRAAATGQFVGKTTKPKYVPARTR